MPDRELLSHNLRTPLTTIRLVLDLCLRRGETLPPEALKEFLLSAIEQTRKLEVAIRDAERDAMSLMAHEEDDVIVLHEESAALIRVIGSKAAARQAPKT